jgi:seryl-tRNA synthetase
MICCIPSVLVAESHALKTQLASSETELTALKDELEYEASKIPNNTSPDTPIGPEGSGKVLREIGGRPIPSPCLDHVAICHRWQLLDLEAGSMVSGSRFYYLKHELALLEIALIQYAMHKLVRAGYTPILPPDLVKSQYVAACGFQPRDLVETSQVYHIAHSDLSLVGTAEIPLASMYTNVELPHSLSTRPIKHVAFGHAFRTEAGGQGLVRYIHS